MTRSRVLIVEDHILFAECVKAGLSPRYEVVEIVSDGAMVVSAVAMHLPDVLLLDLSLPNRLGMDLITELRASNPELRIIIVSMHYESVIVDMALRLGASGFVAKSMGLKDLQAAVEAVLAGGTFISTPPSVAPARGLGRRRPGSDRLTGRQEEVLRLLGWGLTSAQIATRLGLSYWTIHMHRKNIRNALGFRSDQEMYRYALLLDLDALERSDEITA